MNIAHYEAMLLLDLDDKRRFAIEKLLSEAEDNLVHALADAKSPADPG